MGGLFNYFQQSQHPVFYIPERGGDRTRAESITTTTTALQKIWE
jgi:hypothetical protein